MTDSRAPDHLEAKHERTRDRRLAAIRRWVAYIEDHPPETWGPQQNAVVDGQLEAAQAADLSAEHRQQVERLADAILGESEPTVGESETPDEKSE